MSRTDETDQLSDSTADAVTAALVAELTLASSPDRHTANRALARQLAAVTVAGAVAILDGSIGAPVDAEALARALLAEGVDADEVGDAAALLFGLAVAHIAFGRAAQTDRIGPAVHTAIIGWLTPTMIAFGRLAPPEAAAASGRPTTVAIRLTQREWDVLHALTRTGETAALCAELRIAPGTLKHHLKHLCEKLGAHSRLELLLMARRADLI